MAEQQRCNKQAILLGGHHCGNQVTNAIHYTMRGKLFYLSLFPLFCPPAFPSYPACSMLIALCWPSLSCAGPCSPPRPGVSSVIPCFRLLFAAPGASCLPVLLWPPVSERALAPSSVPLGALAPPHAFCSCPSSFSRRLCLPPGQLFATGTTRDTVRGTPCHAPPFTPTPGRAASYLLALCPRPSVLLLPPLSMHALCEQCAKLYLSPRLSISRSAPVVWAPVLLLQPWLGLHLCRIHTSPTGVWERTKHRSNTSSPQPKAIEGIIMYFDVPSSKMQPRGSDKVFGSTNGRFSLTLVDSHALY